MDDEEDLVMKLQSPFDSDVTYLVVNGAYGEVQWWRYDLRHDVLVLMEPMKHPFAAE